MIKYKKKSILLKCHKILKKIIYNNNSFMEKNIPKYQFFDIAANLTDDQFAGTYHGK